MRWSAVGQPVARTSTNSEQCTVQLSPSKQLLLVLVAACGPAALQDTTRGPADSLQGTWRIARFTTRSLADTLRTFPFGLAPRGYLVYDATGHVFFQAIRSTAIDSLRRGLERDAPQAALFELTAGFMAHFGTYAVDTVRRTVTHIVEGELPPRSGSFEVATPFRLTADSLILGSDSLQAWHFVRVR